VCERERDREREREREGEILICYFYDIKDIESKVTKQEEK
jgi:hypothetical protein